MAGIELFNQNRATTSVTSGGTTAPSSGASETWTVTSSSMFGAAVTGTSQFHVADPQLPSEIIAVTNVSGTTWTVTRGAEGTTPVAHAAGFAVYQVVTTGALNNFTQAFNVRAFGALGNGSTNDAAKIGAAITAAGVNNAVYFPYGTYVADNLAPLSGQTWFGPGTILRPPGSSNSVIAATGLTGFTMHQVTVDGNQANSSATYEAAIYLTESTWCNILGVTVQNLPSANAGILLQGAVRCIIDGCQVTNVGYGIIIGLSYASQYPCYGNTISNCTIDTTVWDAIFLTENLSSANDPIAGSVNGTVITGCVVRNFGDGGIEVGQGTSSTSVTGCTLDGTSNGNGNAGIYMIDSWYSTVSDCVVSNLTKEYSYGISAGSRLDTCRNCSVSNVNVYNVAGNGIIFQGVASDTQVLDLNITGGVISNVASDGIDLFFVNGFTVTGVQIENCGGQGISVGQYNTVGSGAIDGTITGCRIFNSAQGITGASGIVFFQDSSDVVVTGCRVGDNQVTKTQTYGINIYDSIVSNITIGNCDLNGNRVSPFNTNSTNSIQASFNGITALIGQFAKFASIGPNIQISSSSIAVNPASLSDIIVAVVIDTNASATPTAITGGNCTWAQIGASQGHGAAFVGTPTAIGSASATVTWSGSPGSPHGAVQEFFAVSGWTFGSIGSVSSAGTNTWASLTPSVVGELYFGWCEDSGTAVAGSTPGFVYTVDGNGNGAAYNVSCTSSAQAPVWGDSGMTTGIMVLLVP